jgi:hypothetical protein
MMGSGFCSVVDAVDACGSLRLRCVLLPGNSDLHLPAGASDEAAVELPLEAMAIPALCCLNEETSRIHSMVRIVDVP